MRVYQVPDVLSLEQANTLIIGHGFGCTVCGARDLLSTVVGDVQSLSNLLVSGKCRGTHGRLCRVESQHDHSLFF